jgi:hypothetical protein
MMKKGQTIRVKVPWQMGYGENGYPGKVKPKQNLEYEITLVDFEKVVGDPTNKENRDDFIPDFVKDQGYADLGDVHVPEHSFDDLVLDFSDGNIVDFTAFYPDKTQSVEERK